MNTPPRTLTVTECQQLLDALLLKTSTHKQHRKAIRNHTMALLMLDAGLRVGEVVGLKQNNLYYIDKPRDALFVSKNLGHGNLDRTIPLSGRAQGAIDEMDKEWWCMAGHLPNYYAFYRTDPTVPITTRQVERITRAASLRSLGRPIHPHVLRHTFASRLMRTVNARIVQELLGHKHLSSTQIYTHPNQEDLKYAIAQLDREYAEYKVGDIASPTGPDAPDRADTPETDGDVR